MRNVAALYVVENGVYYGLLGVEPWCESDDARTYDGPFVVVAHPPCDRWGRYWSGGPSGKARKELGADHGCFRAALSAVQRFHGVLEHPEGSHAFRHFNLPIPRWREGWTGNARLGWSCCVAQGNYGHRARKLTWLYCFSFEKPAELDWSIPAPRSRLDYGFHSKEERAAKRDNVSPQVNATRLTARENLATPIPFRDLLLAIARESR